MTAKYALPGEEKRKIFRFPYDARGIVNNP